MKTPFILSELGYSEDPTKPLRFVSKQGAPFFPVSLPDERHQNAGELNRLVVTAAHDAGKGYGIGFAAAEIIRQSGDVEQARGLLRVWSVDPAVLDPNDAATLREHGLIPREGDPELKEWANQRARAPKKR